MADSKKGRCVMKCAYQLEKEEEEKRVRKIDPALRSVSEQETLDHVGEDVCSYYIAATLACGKKMGGGDMVFDQFGITKSRLSHSKACKLLHVQAVKDATKKKTSKRSKKRDPEGRDSLPTARKRRMKMNSLSSRAQVAAVKGIALTFEGTAHIPSKAARNILEEAGLEVCTHIHHKLLPLSL